MAFHNNVIAGAAGQSGGADAYTIQRSLRFNKDDGAYLDRTPSSQGDRRKFTWSGWVKRNELDSSGEDCMFSAGNNPWFDINFRADQLTCVTNAGVGGVGARTEAYFRDVSAWYHVVCVVNTEESTASDRIKFWVNGVRQTTTANTGGYPAQDSDNIVNTAIAHRIGADGRVAGGGIRHANIQLAEIHFLDGIAISNPDGVFGEFNSTTGVWDPIEANITSPNDGTTWSSTLTATSAHSSGNPASYGFDGIPSASDPNTFLAGAGGDCVWDASSYGFTNVVVEVYVFGVGGTLRQWQVNSGTAINEASSAGWQNLGTYSTLSEIRCNGVGGGYGGAISAIRLNGVTLVDGAKAHGKNGFHLDFSDNSSNVALGYDAAGSNDWTVNNISSGASVANKGFDVVTYTGTGSTQTVSGLNFQPDFVWIKSRTSAADHELFDSVRGATKRLFSSLSNAETTITSGLTSFNSDGFTLGGHGGSSGSGTDYVAWCWKAGGTAASNTDGNITSSVSANTDYGFSIATISSATGSSTASLGHGLGAQPNLIIQKSRSNTYGWQIYAKISGSYKYLSFSGDAASNTTTGNMGITPTSSTVGLGSNFTGSNNYVYYCWTEIPGFSKISTYAGTGSSHTVTCGFRPAYVIVKCTSSGSTNWHVFDRLRGTERLVANTSADQGSPAAYAPTFTDTGFTVANVSDTHTNASGQTYLFAAFAEGDSSGIDSLLDSPTNYEASSGNNGGNYCTLNPLDRDRNGKVTVSNGNLEATGTSNQYGFVKGTLAPASGKFYYEATTNGAQGGGYGLAEATAPDQVSGSNPDYTIASAYRNYAYFYTSGFQIYIDNSLAYTGSAVSDGDVVGVAVDVDAGKVWFSHNGVWQGSGTQNPATGAGGYSPTYLKTACPVFQDGAGSPVPTGKFNFGQRDYKYTPPTNFKSFCTQNFNDPLIADGSDYFDTKLWTGDGTSNRDITGYSFSPDLVWIKRRSSTSNHLLADTIRGVNKGLFSNLTSAEQNVSTLPAFNSDGFQVSGNGDTNQSSQTFVGWAWDAGSSTVSNTDGTITSSVRANQTAGFSIVTYTGSGSAATVGHGLSTAPEMIILKGRSFADDWRVYHKYLDTTEPEDFYLQLHSSNAKSADQNASFMNDTAPTNSVFSLGTDSAINGSSRTMVAYCFAPVAGFSAFGSYEGNNSSSDGAFIHTGFRPRFLIIKSIDTTQYWYLADTARSSVNDNTTEGLWANTNDSEFSYNVDFLSNGIKHNNTSANLNSANTTFVYAAFAESPLKYARAR